MKLTMPQASALQKETGAQIIDDAASVRQQLVDTFGDHTFFLNDDGLHVWELIKDDQTNSQQMAVIQIAAWEDDQKSALATQEPKVFKLLQLDDSDGSDPAA